MRVLGIETSTPQGSIAICDGEVILCEKLWFSQKGHLSFLHRSILSILEETGISLKDIDLVGVSIGPGSFTGLRIALATAKGICFSHSKPIKGVSSLKVLAMGVTGESKIYPVIDAKRGLVYGGCYSWKNGELLQEFNDCLCLPEEFIKRIEGGIVIGDGVRRFKTLFQQKEGINFLHPILDYPFAHNLCILAMREYVKGGGDSLYSLEPRYIKPSEAEFHLSSGGKK